MRNERLSAALIESGYTERGLAEQIGIDPKSVQRWITKSVTPRRTAAHKVARLLGVEPGYLWPDLIARTPADRSRAEVVAFYPHRSDTPRKLWADLLAGTSRELWLFANASLFLPEENPDSISVIARKAREGVRVRVLMGDPDSPAATRRGEEERLYDGIPGRIRVALTYYIALAQEPGVEFLLHRTSLYNSIFRYDDQMLVNQHVYGMYGYMAPILHLHKVEGGDLFDMYAASFERVRETAYPIQESSFWRQRGAGISPPALGA